MSTTLRRLRGEAGWALVTGVMVTGLMLTLGLASFAYVDTQVRQSGNERNRESAFNYSEGLLDSEMHLLAANWPGSATRAIPDCTKASTDTRCPSAAEMAKVFNTADYTTVASSWIVRVRDNGGTQPCSNNAALQTCNYFYDASVLSQPAWDANGDGEMWVWAQGRVQQRAGSPAKRRTLVARISVERIPIEVPHSVVTAGGFSTHGSPHLDVNTGGSPINVRCDMPTTGNQWNVRDCFETRNGQVTPFTVTDEFAQNESMSDPDLDRLALRAQAEGGLYDSCPTNPTSKIVFVRVGNCSNASLPPGTTPGSPGILVIRSGTLNVIGSVDYHGLIYLANRQTPTNCGNVFSSNGNHIFTGSIQVDYCGQVEVGTSSNSSLTYNSNFLSNLYSYGNANLIRNSFREVEAQ